jgi:protein-L-isoaspartate(D-aspartate) O-methyltransferase
MKKNDALNRFFNKLNRSFFIDNESVKPFADEDCALPIEFGQTISQPSLVRSMTEHLDLEKTHRVLEIGTGSGYQTAFLAAFSGMVFSVERISELSLRAKEKLQILGFHNIRYKIGDGSEGWPEEAPFDRIIVTCAARKIPDPLLAQLAAGGKMILPVGERPWQELLLITKQKDSTFSRQDLGAVVFVELKGKYGF